MKNSFDVVVIGGGAAGAASLFEVSKRSPGRHILLEQKENLGRGSTGAWGSLIRVYHLSPHVSQLAAETVPYYLGFEERIGCSSGFTQTGSLYFMKQSELSRVREQLSELNRGSCQLQILLPKEGREQFPSFQWREDDFAVLEPYAGFACPWQTTESWVKASESFGATGKTQTQVVDFVVERDRVVAVRTLAGETYSGHTFVLATGAWSPTLAEKLEETLEIVPRAIQVSYFHRRASETRDPFFVDLPSRSFGRPAPDGSFLGGYVLEEPAAGVEFVQHIDLKEAYEAKRRLAGRLSWIKNAALTGGIRAVEGYTPDMKGLLKYSQRYENLILAAGWSCTGFTLAPYIGQTVAKLVAERGKA